MHGTHQSPLVAVSIVIAIISSYTALALTARVTAARDGARRAWLFGGSFAMGTGIWSMHFVAMLAFHLPVQIAYSVPLVLLSLLAAVAASALALIVASRPTVSAAQLIAAAAVMGGGIATMHYTGMAAMRLPAQINYHFWLVALSLLIAFTASLVALWIFRSLRSDTQRHVGSLRAGAAVILGLAITGLHFTAMTAAIFTEIGAPGDAVVPASGLLIATDGLAIALILGTALILALTLTGSVVDHWVRVKLAGAEALRESETRYRSVVSQVHEVIFRTDEHGRWVFLNPAWTEITGFEESESIGSNQMDYVYPEDRRRESDAFDSLARGTESSTRHEVRYLTKDGGTRWIEVHARVSRDERGQFLGTAGTLRDVTLNHKAEEALRAARETAEAASRAKSEFLSRMSHELRTPLNAILGFGQLLELENLSDDNRESVDHIMRGGRHLLDLINEVLDMTGIEAGRLRLSPEPVALAEVIRESVDLLKPLAAKRGIALKAHDAQGCTVHVLADRQRLKQVLLNLISNAIKYNSVNGLVAVTVQPAESGRMIIAIADTGEGISADKIGRLFTPFERLGAEQSGVEGTGLGLALSKRLTEAMGGAIGAISEVGRGSTFSVELPVVESPVEQLMRSGVQIAVREASETLRQLTILYVEDNLANLALVQRIMTSRQDLRLIPCMQGDLALELARVHKPDLLLLDLHLPDISGEEVLRRLRQSPDTRDIPVIAVSADATVGQADRLLELGAQGYVTKPIDVRRFLASIDGALQPTARAA